MCMEVVLTNSKESFKEPREGYKWFVKHEGNLYGFIEVGKDEEPRPVGQKISSLDFTRRQFILGFSAQDPYEHGFHIFKGEEDAKIWIKKGSWRLTQKGYDVGAVFVLHKVEYDSIVASGKCYRREVDVSQEITIGDEVAKMKKGTWATCA